MATCERLFEAYLRPDDQPVLEGFPFTSSGFYADNGSEYITGRRPALTKPRPRYSNDNSLAETENGTAVRKC